MKRKSALLLAICLLPLSIRAADSNTPAPSTSPLGLPNLEPSGSKRTLPNSTGLAPSNDPLFSTGAPNSSNPKPNSSNKADKDWLVNGLLEVQKKQQEDRDLQKQKQQQESNQYFQQEYERQKKLMLGTGSNNSLEDTKDKFNISLSSSDSKTATYPSSISTLNLPNSRLSVSGSGLNNLSGLPSFSDQMGNQPNGNYSKQNSNPSSPYGNPDPSYNNSLPNNNSQWNTVNLPRTSNSLDTQNPNLNNNLIPQAPSSFKPGQQPLLPNAPYANPLNSPAQNSPFTSAQAANMLKQMDQSKTTSDPGRPTMKDLNNGIPNPADIRRF